MARGDPLTPARVRFAIGDRVREVSPLLRRYTRNSGRAATGTVTGYGRYGHTVAVRRDGQTQPVGYHCRDWEKVA